MLTLDQVKAKSAKNLGGLHPVVLRATEVLIEQSYRKGIYVMITQGLRTVSYQNELYAQGRTQSQLNAAGLSHVKAQPDKIKVTDAKGGTSYHNFGVAVDFALLLPDGKQVTWDMNTDYNSNNIKDWIEVVDLAKKLGFAWGGDWTTFKDYPHFQMTFGLTTADYRAGAKPSEAKVKSANAVIDKFLSTLNKEEEEPMTAAEKKAFDEMSALIKEQSKAIAELKERATELEFLSKQPKIPSWALPYCEEAKSAGFLDTTANGSYDFYRMVTLLGRAGMFKKSKPV